jgi:hypothetical protein
MPALVLLSTVALVWPNTEIAARVYSRQLGSEAPRYQAMVDAAAWLEANSTPDALIGFDDEAVRQIFYELDGSRRMSMVPQVFVQPDERGSPLPMVATGWTDVGKLGTKAPTPTAPLVKLLVHRTGRYFVAMEGDKLLDWLRDPAMSFLIVTRQTPIGLGAIEPFLASQPGLQLAWSNTGEHELDIYRVDPSVIADTAFPVFATPDAVGRFALGVPTQVESLVDALNPNGWFPVE